MSENKTRVLGLAAAICCATALAVTGGFAGVAAAPLLGIFINIFSADMVDVGRKRKDDPRYKHPNEDLTRLVGDAIARVLYNCAEDDRLTDRAARKWCGYLARNAGVLWTDLAPAPSLAALDEKRLPDIFAAAGEGRDLRLLDPPAWGLVLDNLRDAAGLAPNKNAQAFAAQRLHEDLFHEIRERFKIDFSSDGRAYAAMNIDMSARILAGVQQLLDERATAPGDTELLRNIHETLDQFIVAQRNALSPEQIVSMQPTLDQVDKIEKHLACIAEQLSTHDAATQAELDRIIAQLEAIKVQLEASEVQQEASKAPSPQLLNVRQISEPTQDFVGREEEKKRLLAALRGKGSKGAVILGVRGMGGVGKTELAKIVAKQLKKRFPDGQIAFNLRGARDDDTTTPATAIEALQHVIRSLHHDPEEHLPEEEDSLRGLYHSVLEGKRVLLLMDNALNPQQLTPLIPPPDGCGLMVTSRYRFFLSGMEEIDLNTLPVREAGKLLLKICPRIGEHANALADRCGYLPLALRLAASALKVYAMIDVSDYLRDLTNEKERLAMLDRYSKGTNEERGVEASLAISYRLLDEHRQRYWRALAVFPGDFDATATASVWELAEHAAVEELRELYAANMVEWDQGTGRYRLHDLARDYAQGRLTEEERTSDQLRHAAHYARVLKVAEELYANGGESVSRGLALFDAEQANVRAGQAWAAAHREADTAAAKLCSHYPDAGPKCLDLRLHPRELVAWLELAIEAARKLGDRGAETNRLSDLGLAYDDLSEPHKALQCYTQALPISREIHDRPTEGRILGNLGSAYEALGKLRKAIECHEAALVISREIPDRRAEGQDLGNLGTAYMGLGEYRKAIECHEQALAIDIKIGDWRGVAQDLGSLGLAYINLGEPRKAIEYNEQDLAIARKIGDRQEEGEALSYLGRAYAGLGQPRKAMECHAQALVISQELEYRRNEGENLNDLGLAYSALGDSRQAIELYDQALAIAREIGDRQGEGKAHYNFAQELANTGRRDEAITHAEQAVEIYEEIETIDAVNARSFLEQLQKY